MNLYENVRNNLNKSEKVSEKLTKDNKDTLEVGDILADSTNQYKIANIIKTPKSMAITVRDTKENRPIFADPISNWYGTKIIKSNLKEAVEIGYDDYYDFGADENEDTLYCDECGQPVKAEFCYVSDENDPNPEIYCWPCHDRLVANGALMEAEGKQPAYVICYGTLEIWPDRDSAREYYEEGVAMSEGAEQQRYGNIAFALYKGNNFGDDEGPEMVTKIVDKNPDGSTKTERVNAGKMTHEQAFEYINKLVGLHESEDTCIYTCNDCGNEFECNQIFNKDKEGNPICPKCGSGNIIKEE